MSDIMTQKQRSLCMSKIKSRNTNPEIAVRKTLSSLKIKYRLHDSDLPGKPDIKIPTKKIIIFINGCFWHQHKNCKRSSMPKSNKIYWKPKLLKNIEKQKSDIKKLKKSGWKVLVVWECETKKPALTKRLTKILNEKN